MAQGHVYSVETDERNRSLYVIKVFVPFILLHYTTTNMIRENIKAFRNFSFPSILLSSHPIPPHTISSTITKYVTLPFQLTLFLFNYLLPQSQSSSSPNHKLFTVSLTHISKLTVPLVQVEQVQSKINTAKVLDVEVSRITQGVY